MMSASDHQRAGGGAARPERCGKKDAILRAVSGLLPGSAGDVRFRRDVANSRRARSHAPGWCT